MHYFKHFLDQSVWLAICRQVAQEEVYVRLLTQPGDGLGPLITAVKRAQQRVEIVIFRFDDAALEQALVAAAERGVKVSALIAFTNHGGEKNLRKLEARFLAKGITVARTADDLQRYHGKMVIIDGRELHLLSYNYTHLDVDKSRSFGIVTTNRALVQEASRLFECDCARQPYSAGCSRFVVSPINARRELAEFIRGARKQLLIYDVEIADTAMIRLIQERARAGVAVRIIGTFCGKTKTADPVAAHKLATLRLHTRLMVRDHRRIFLGSQSLRRTELDARREIGIIVDDLKAAAAIEKIFERDWEQSASEKPAAIPELTGRKALKKVAKAISKNLPPAHALADAIREEFQQQTNGRVDRRAVESAVKGAVKEAVKDAVKKAVSTVVDDAIKDDSHADDNRRAEHRPGPHRRRAAGAGGNRGHAESGR
jgi:cardiolipin synthase A/B